MINILKYNHWHKSEKTYWSIDFFVQDPDTYQAAMMVVADELVLEMTQEEAERQLQSMDFLISGGNALAK